jgi:hypothetical protein
MPDYYSFHEDYPNIELDGCKAADTWLLVVTLSVPFSEISYINSL